MSTFFQQTVQAMTAKHIDRFPLLELDQVIDWQPIEQYLRPLQNSFSPTVEIQTQIFGCFYP